MKVFLILLTIGFLALGGQALLTTVTNLKRATFTIEEYVEKRPRGKLLKLKNCHLDLVDCSYESILGSDRPTEVYIPVRRAEAQEDDPVVVLLATKDKEILDLVEEMNLVPNEEQFEKFLEQNLDRLFPIQDISGLVRFGLEMDSGERDDLKDIAPNLADDFVLMDEGKSLPLAEVLMFPAGLLLGWIALFKIDKKPSPPALQPGPPALPPQQPQGPPPLG